MLTIPARIIALQTTSSDGVEVALVVHGETLEVETTLDAARALAAHLGEDLELVLRVPGGDTRPRAVATQGDGHPPTQEANTPGRAAPARASKRSRKASKPRKKKVRACAGCDEDRRIKARGMCGPCYERARRDGNLQGPRRRSLKRLVTQLGATETAKRLGIETLLLGRYLDGVEDIPGDVAQTIAREQSIITRAAKRRRAGQEAPVFADPPTRAETLAGAQRP